MVVPVCLEMSFASLLEIKIPFTEWILAAWLSEKTYKDSQDFFTD